MRVLKTEDCFYVAGGDDGDGGDGNGHDGYANDNVSNSGGWGSNGTADSTTDALTDTTECGLRGAGRQGLWGAWGNAIYDGLKWGADALINSPQTDTPRNSHDYTRSPFFTQGA